ncbi:hypothetical protein M501DRAFT_991301 [Patellaria atrata CBS 101060]|uniref:Uncharacterized protein n=1 Tax=Patellaria atrata CBS 101060 TaxID=1346257 RepID=A0A9P4SEG5_9PEZI|nr:hypothetical protein M501DRAFT_991301 [Patellaria atrata CBS 101060]
MQFPKLTPLQSRLAASLTTAVILIVILFSLSPRHSAYAAEIDSILNDEHNHHWLPENVDAAGLSWDDEKDQDAYEAEFLGLDRGIIGRAPAGVDGLDNNTPSNLNLDPGRTNNYVFENKTLWGNHSATGLGLPALPRTRETRDVGEFATPIEIRQDRASQTTRLLYISINVCSQPTRNGTSTSTGPPPQLTLYISQSERNQRPSPDANELDMKTLPLNEGFQNCTIDATGDVYIGVHAPELPQGFSGGYNYDLAASIDGYYHSWTEDEKDSPLLYLVDSDTSSALLVTSNLTQNDITDRVYQNGLNMRPPFQIFAFNENETSIKGLEHSYCGLKTMNASTQVITDRSMTVRGLGNHPKEQFYVRNLNHSSTYLSYLAIEGNSTNFGAGTVGGGDNNCRVVFNLTFCSEVAYAVPSNPELFPDRQNLADMYDKNAAHHYQNFNYSLQQIPCSTTANDTKYSLVRNCTHCARDYKNWLCAVTIPRCADFSTSSQLYYLQPRNLAQAFINGSRPLHDTLTSHRTLTQRLGTNSSRNPWIDEEIRPGPYKEVLPCEDLCYNVVQSCPAAFGFGCPTSGQGLEMSYGTRNEKKGVVTCNFPGQMIPAHAPNGRY